MAFVRSVLGDVSPDRLGVTLAHEHLIIDSPLVATSRPEIHLPSVEEAVGEAKQLSDAGVGAVVDAMPVGSGGDPAALAAVARGSGLQVVATTGMHTARYYEEDDWYLTASADDAAERFSQSIEGTPPRCGVIKAATSGLVPSGMERRLFAAAAIAMLATGAPLLTHCEGGQGAMAQIGLIADLGIPVSRVAISHTDKVSDPAYQTDLLEAGVYLCLDQGLRDPSRTAELIVELCSAGFAGQLLIGTDGARRSLWSTLGGSPGLAWIQTGFRPLLTEMGLDREQLDTIFRVNPTRWLTIDR